MRTWLYFGFTVLTVALDVALVNLALVVGYRVRFESGLFAFIEFHPWSAYLGLAVFQGVVLPVVSALRNQYRPRRRLLFLDELQRAFGSVSVAVVIALAVSAVLPSRDFAYSRMIVAVDWGLGIVLVGLGRVLVFGVQRAIVSRLSGEGRTIIVGNGEMGRAVRERLRQSPQLGYRLVGVVSDRGGVEADADLPVLGGIDAIADVIAAHGVREVIIAEPALGHERILDIVAQCDRQRVSVKVFPDVFQIISSEVSIDDLSGLPMVTVRDVALRGWQRGIKRAVDLIVSVGVFVFLSPLMLAVAVLIKLTSSDGPVFYIQERVGLDGRPMQVVKFRTMVPDAEARTGPVWARASDPRVTPLGRFLRRFSIDELPQFTNVLLGEMSVVGPRPERPHFVAQFSQRMPRYLERHREKAGITGWAQINGLRGNASIEERTAYDLWYVENWTLWLDFKIMLRTLTTIFLGRGAY